MRDGGRRLPVLLAACAETDRVENITEHFVATVAPVFLSEA